MPLDRPVFPGEAEIGLQTATLTSSGCSNAALAVDDDPATAATFGAPDAGAVPKILTEWQPPLGPAPDSYNLKRSNVQSGETLLVSGIAATHYLDADVASGQPYWYEVTAVYANVESGPSNEVSLTPAANEATRFLRVEWGYDAFIARLRLSYSGSGAGNVGVDYESTLAADAGAPAPGDISLSCLPYPVGASEQEAVPWDPSALPGDNPAAPPDAPISESAIYEIVFDPPVLGRGVVFYPDALLPAPSAAPVTLNQLQVYESIQQGAFSMSRPTVSQARVGCSGAVITPRAENTPTTYPFPQALAAVLQSIQKLDFTTTSKLAREIGGDTVHQINGWETDREVKCKVTMMRHDYQLLQNVLGGALVVDPANGNVGETQYFAPGYTDHAPYFSVVAQSTNGNPGMQTVYPKCKMDGSLNQNLERDKPTEVEVDFVVFWDPNYTRQDGTVGGLYEQVFTNGGPVGLHS